LPPQVQPLPHVAQPLIQPAQSVGHKPPAPTPTTPTGQPSQVVEQIAISPKMFAWILSPSLILFVAD
jgi:hypothetical protein